MHEYERRARRARKDAELASDAAPAVEPERDLIADNDPFQGLPPVGTYWTSGNLPTALGMIHQEAYATCARCGSFVNAEDRHDDWHRTIERALRPEGQR